MLMAVYLGYVKTSSYYTVWWCAAIAYVPTEIKPVKSVFIAKYYAQIYIIVYILYSIVQLCDSIVSVNYTAKKLL